MVGLCAPLSTLRYCPRGQPRMTRGRCGSLLLHRDGLAPSTPCRSPGALRFTPNTGHPSAQSKCPLWAKAYDEDEVVLVRGPNDLHQLCLLLQIDGLVMPSLVELCTPHLVHALVIRPTEDHGRADPNVEVVQIFQSPD